MTTTIAYLTGDFDYFVFALILLRHVNMLAQLKLT